MTEAAQLYPEVLWNDQGTVVASGSWSHTTTSGDQGPWGPFAGADVEVPAGAAYAILTGTVAVIQDLYWPANGRLRVADAETGVTLIDGPYLAPANGGDMLPIHLLVTAGRTLRFLFVDVGWWGSGSSLVGTLHLTAHFFDQDPRIHSGLRCRCVHCGRGAQGGGPAGIVPLTSSRGTVTEAFWTPLEHHGALGPPSSVHVRLGDPIWTPPLGTTYNDETEGGQPAPNADLFAGMTKHDLHEMGTVPVVLTWRVRTFLPGAEAEQVQWDQWGWNLGRADWPEIGGDDELWMEGPPESEGAHKVGANGCIDLALPVEGTPVFLRALGWVYSSIFGDRACYVEWWWQASVYVLPHFTDGIYDGGQVTSEHRTSIFGCQGRFMLKTDDETVGGFHIERWHR